MIEKREKSYIVFLSTFPPRECGIGTFTADLAEAIDEMLAPQVETRVVAMNSDEITHFRYPSKVLFLIQQAKSEDYTYIAERLNEMPHVRVVSIQHEFGIFGGDYGMHLLHFLAALKKPAVITFHTVPSNPSVLMLEVMKKISAQVKGIIVMTNRSQELLVNIYGIEGDKIQVIPHGIHPLPYTQSAEAKSLLNLSQKTILSTFGLLNSGKGIEYVLDALPEVIKQIPNALYLILGKTHPSVLTKEGEAYRNFLMQKVHALGLENHVRFYNKFLPLKDLLQFLQATDVYLATSLDPDHSVSGTLSYALGTGRPVVSTAFAQAKEYITEEVGLLVDFKNPAAYADSLLKMLTDASLREQFGKNAYFRTRNMIWPNVAISYLRFFARMVPGLQISQKALPPIKFSHFFRLTDNFGMFQFAHLTKPSPEFGYTVDDNARALIAAGLYYEQTKKPGVLALIKIYLTFLEYAAGPNVLAHALVQAPKRLFENYINADRSFDTMKNNQENLEDANARALYALARISSISAIPKTERARARELFFKGVNCAMQFGSPRAIAFYCKGLAFICEKEKNSELGTILRFYCDRLVKFYSVCSDEQWQWFEEYLTYSNAVLSEALLLSYRATSETRYLEVGKKTLDFLIQQTFEEGMYMAIGQDGWFKKGSRREYFDQQSEDASAMVQGLKAMYDISKDKQYRTFMYQAFYWFLGDNILGQVVYDRTTGGCYDGIGRNYINLNQGAESTISYQLARLAVEG
ncbi:hypothetical protein A3B21_02625 [Candidatus Uhrbacteria bacterium RIFCSPLOWO2_01_FULL_47_24]|uniref:Glycosyl transferase family 1 domain-containing protein n=1 Tax=Candidatus Uhrbacteria bacterium RIFCSPLOWO2_01_FULL_47_24 TaxID=1802401 RepID=A0A1F7UQN1_9BACT|nr:MAG: hypothetical protein A2753_00595 [Candidatus Uhrbacteria bacterium RIFCSPHIGHO2_01_FULL_47_11]OGL68297.1 MAG: hypothetical protein A3D58_04845 [Candidatus Uhrbacteria bacterium RIFCSPHIGHO2_02_FULL_46_47]OGL75709.1 MAG: hypothetical protein A3F52_01855 [Candidatus Uhrbacteria bacterium RIFCSPHIGHO2_12_FULL_47_11]OGL80034.1 MAG: hypothetical protein A3B21_02625 [Candidatus Uhrbacteria bacterium RIFCSPLOWO2_01_FULL_47_24]OGL85232.1 MAG: hypothetical protein A3J03_00215 [Candidatus Uhrbact